MNTCWNLHTFGKLFMHMMSFQTQALEAWLHQYHIASRRDSVVLTRDMKQAFRNKYCCTCQSQPQYMKHSKLSFISLPTHHEAFSSSVSSVVPPHVCHPATCRMLPSLQKAGSSLLLPLLSPPSTAWKPLSKPQQAKRHTTSSLLRYRGGKFSFFFLVIHYFIFFLI